MSSSLRVADHDFRFFADRGLGSRILPAKLRDAGWKITTMDERYGVMVSQDLDDPDWIREATSGAKSCYAKILKSQRTRSKQKQSRCRRPECSLWRMQESPWTKVLRAISRMKSGSFGRSCIEMAPSS